MNITELVTHEGHFHADDVMAAAILTTLYPSAKLFRSRNEEMIKSKDGRIVWDVGHTHDLIANIFDHHQEGGAGVRENGVPYASLGLVWKYFGKKYLILIGTPKDKIDIIWEQVDNNFVQPLDAHDTGHQKLNNTTSFANLVSQRIPSIIFKNENGKWVTSNDPEESDYLKGFMELIPHAKARLYDYCQSLIKKININNDRLFKFSEYLVFLSFKSIALGKISSINIPNVKKYLYGIKKIILTTPYENFYGKVFKKLGIPSEYHQSIIQKLHYKIFKDIRSGHDSQINLLSMVYHSILSSVDKTDVEFLNSIHNIIKYGEFYFKNMILSTYRAKTGHDFTDYYINNNPRTDGILILPNGAEYTSRVHLHNKLHPDNIITTAIYPYFKSGEKIWNLKHVSKDYGTYETFKKIPEAARGKIGDEIADALGLPGFYGKYKFAHNAGHLLVANDLDAALAAAKLSS